MGRSPSGGAHCVSISQWRTGQQWLCTNGCTDAVQHPKAEPKVSPSVTGDQGRSACAVTDVRMTCGYNATAVPFCP